MTEMKNQKTWNFQIGAQGGVNLPIWIVIGFQQQKRQDTQDLNNDSFCRLPVTSCHCIIGMENYPGAALLLTYNNDDYSQGYRQIKEALRV